MDLSRIKSAKADNDFFYLEHADRAPFKIAKKGLSPRNRKLIEEYCSGGEVKGYAGDKAAANPAGQVVTPDPNTSVDPATGLVVFNQPPPPAPVDTGFADTSSILDTPMEALSHMGGAISGGFDKLNRAVDKVSGEDVIR